MEVVSLIKKFLKTILGENNAAKIKLLSKGFGYRNIIKYVDIDGWLSPDEAIELYTVAKNLPENHPIIVEIGSWVGKSSLVLAKGIESKNSPILYCIDPFNGGGDLTYLNRKSNLNVDLKEKFINNMIDNNIFNIIKILEGYSFDFVKKFNEKIDFLFIDGNHEYESVLRDFNEWSPLIKPGGIIAFHDCYLNNGPWKVVNSKLHNNSSWKDRRYIDSIFVAKKITD